MFKIISTNLYIYTNLDVLYRFILIKILRFKTPILNILLINTKKTYYIYDKNIFKRYIANQFIENPKLTKLKRFYVYTMMGKKKCRVLDLRNSNGEQRLILVLYVRPGKISNPKIPINDNLMFEEIEDVGDEGDYEIEAEEDKEFGGNKKSKKVKKNKKRTNKNYY